MASKEWPRGVMFVCTARPVPSHAAHDYSELCKSPATTREVLGALDKRDLAVLAKRHPIEVSEPKVYDEVMGILLQISRGFPFLASELLREASEDFETSVLGMEAARSQSRKQPPPTGSNLASEINLKGPAGKRGGERSAMVRYAPGGERSKMGRAVERTTKEKTLNEQTVKAKTDKTASNSGTTVFTRGTKEKTVKSKDARERTTHGNSLGSGRKDSSGGGSSRKDSSGSSSSSRKSGGGARRKHSVFKLNEGTGGSSSGFSGKDSGGSSRRSDSGNFDSQRGMFGSARGNAKRSSVISEQHAETFRFKYATAPQDEYTQEENESIENFYALHSETGWSHFSLVNGVEMLERDDDVGSLQQGKAHGIVPNCTPHEVLEDVLKHFREPLGSVYTQHALTSETRECLEVVNDHSAIMYGRRQLAPPLFPRDVVTKYVWKELEPGLIVFVNESCEHPSKPRSKTVVRATVKFWGEQVQRVRQRPPLPLTQLLPARRRPEGDPQLQRDTRDGVRTGRSRGDHSG
jgi:hypothetical protein